MSFSAVVGALFWNHIDSHIKSKDCDNSNYDLIREFIIIIWLIISMRLLNWNVLDKLKSSLKPEQSDYIPKYGPPLKT